MADTHTLNMSRSTNQSQLQHESEELNNFASFVIQDNLVVSWGAIAALATSVIFFLVGFGSQFGSTSWLQQLLTPIFEDQFQQFTQHVISWMTRNLTAAGNNPEPTATETENINGSPTPGRDQAPTTAASTDAAAVTAATQVMNEDQSVNEKQLQEEITELRNSNEQARNTLESVREAARAASQRLKDTEDNLKNATQQLHEYEVELANMRSGQRDQEDANAKIQQTLHQETELKLCLQSQIAGLKKSSNDKDNEIQNLNSRIKELEGIHKMAALKENDRISDLQKVRRSLENRLDAEKCARAEIQRQLEAEKVVSKSTKDALKASRTEIEMIKTETRDFKRQLEANQDLLAHEQKQIKEMKAELDLKDRAIKAAEQLTPGLKKKLENSQTNASDLEAEREELKRKLVSQDEVNKSRQNLQNANNVLQGTPDKAARKFWEEKAQLQGQRGNFRAELIEKNKMWTKEHDSRIQSHASANLSGAATTNKPTDTTISRPEDRKMDDSTAPKPEYKYCTDCGYVRYLDDATHIKSFTDHHTGPVMYGKDVKESNCKRFFMPAAFSSSSASPIPGTFDAKTGQRLEEHREHGEAMPPIIPGNHQSANPVLKVWDPKGYFCEYCQELISEDPKTHQPRTLDDFLVSHVQACKQRAPKSKNRHKLPGGGKGHASIKQFDKYTGECLPQIYNSASTSLTNRKSLYSPN